MVRRGWDSGLDFEEAYRRILSHMLGSGSPYDVVLLVQLRNGSRIGEAVEAVRQFCASGQDLVLVRVEKHKDSDMRLMVLPEELRSVEGRQLLSEACAALSALRNPKGGRQGVLPQGLRLQHPQPSLRLRFLPPEEGRQPLDSGQNHGP